MERYDVIVIGGGHNGLTTAAILAGTGRKVRLLEKRNVLGGIAASEEFHPGYRTTGLLHDTSSVRADVIETLNLREHGLRTTGRRAPVMLLSDDGRNVTVDGNGDRSYDSIAKVSVKDADAYRRYCAFAGSVRPWITRLLHEPQPNLGNPGFAELRKIALMGIRLRRLGKETMLELLKILPMSAADFLNEYFETSFLKGGIALPALLGTFNGPRSSYTTMNLMLHETMSCDQVVGGPAAVVASLTGAAAKHGVDMSTGTAVKKILVDRGVVRGVALESGEEIDAPVVAASCNPVETFLHLLQPGEIGLKLESEITRFRCRGTAVKLNIALNRRIKWKAETTGPVEFIRIGQGFDDIERAFDAVKYRRFSENPVLDISVPTASDNALAPDGHEVVSVVAGYAPYAPEGGWNDSSRKDLQGRIINQLSRFAVGFRESIVATELLTPKDLEERYGLIGGDLFHGEQAVDQLLGRPVPSCSGYRTPIPGLFLCGSGSHPGGGITCGPGALASRAILSSFD